MFSNLKFNSNFLFRRNQRPYLFSFISFNLKIITTKDMIQWIGHSLLNYRFWVRALGIENFLVGSTCPRVWKSFWQQALPPNEVLRLRNFFGREHLPKGMKIFLIVSASPEWGSEAPMRVPDTGEKPKKTNNNTIFLLDNELSNIQHINQESHFPCFCQLPYTTPLTALLALSLFILVTSDYFFETLVCNGR